MYEVSTAVHLLNDEETPLNDEETTDPSGGIETDQGENPFEPQGLPVKMPVVMVTAIVWTVSQGGQSSKNARLLVHVQAR